MAEYAQDYERERAAAQTAASKASAFGARRVFAESKVHQAWALISLGQLQAAKEALAIAYNANAEGGRLCLHVSSDL